MTPTRRPASLRPDAAWAHDRPGPALLLAGAVTLMLLAGALFAVPMDPDAQVPGPDADAWSDSPLASDPVRLHWHGDPTDPRLVRDQARVVRDLAAAPWTVGVVGVATLIEGDVRAMTNEELADAVADAEARRPDLWPHIAPGDAVLWVEVDPDAEPARVAATVADAVRGRPDEWGVEAEGGAVDAVRDAQAERALHLGAAALAVVLATVGLAVALRSPRRVALVASGALVATAAGAGLAFWLRVPLDVLPWLPVAFLLSAGLLLAFAAGLREPDRPRWKPHRPLVDPAAWTALVSGALLLAAALLAWMLAPVPALRHVAGLLAATLLATVPVALVWLPALDRLLGRDAPTPPRERTPLAHHLAASPGRGWAFVAAASVVLVGALLLAAPAVGHTDGTRTGAVLATLGDDDLQRLVDLEAELFREDAVASVDGPMARLARLDGVPGDLDAALARPEVADRVDGRTVLVRFTYDAADAGAALAAAQHLVADSGLDAKVTGTDALRDSAAVRALPWLAGAWLLGGLVLLVPRRRDRRALAADALVLAAVPTWSVGLLSLAGVALDLPALAAVAVASLAAVRATQATDDARWLPAAAVPAGVILVGIPGLLPLGAAVVAGSLAATAAVGVLVPLVFADQVVAEALRASRRLPV